MGRGRGGARGDAAGGGGAALLFGLHAGCSEPVAWIAGRHDLLPALLVVLAWRLLARGRDAVAGLLLGLSAFAKEPSLLAAIVPLAWGWSAETGPGWAARGGAVAARGRAVAGAGIGAAACVGIRTALGRPLPVGAAAMGPDLLKRDTSSVTPARNTARALAQLGRPADALGYAKEAARRDGGRPASLVLVGRGQVGDLDGAEAAFRGALAADPSDGAATAGLTAVARARGGAP